MHHGQAGLIRTVEAEGVTYFIRNDVVVLEPKAVCSNALEPSAAAPETTSTAEALGPERTRDELVPFLTESIDDVRGVRDLEVMVEKYVLFAARADVDVNGRPKAEMAGLQVFREVQRHLDETKVTEEALNRSLLGALRVIYAQARTSKAVHCPHGVSPS